MFKLVVTNWAQRLRRCLFSLLLLTLFLFCTPGYAALAAGHEAHALVGPKPYYLALGDSLAFGFQFSFDFDDGYVNDYYQNLQSHGVQHEANLGCPGETSVTLITGKCPFPYLRKYPYIGSQLNAALDYLADHRGQVSPVTLDIGANDIIPDLNSSTCSRNEAKFNSDMALVDTNLTQVILPKLRAALTVNGVVTGDLVVMNYYDPYQNMCPDTVPYLQTFNQHLANDVAPFGTMADVFDAFGGAKTPNPNMCNYTWMCGHFKQDIHATDQGYRVIAGAFEQATGY